MFGNLSSILCTEELYISIGELTVINQCKINNHHWLLLNVGAV